MAQKTALLVAGCYPDCEPAYIQGPVNSVARVQETLITYFGFAAEDITFMADTPPTTNFHSPTLIPVNPTFYFPRSGDKTTRDKTTARETVIKHLCNMVNNSKTNDTMLFYFCGHGGRCIDRTHCNDTGYEEYMILADGTKITDSDLRYISEGVPHDRSFVIVADCCNSGGLLDGAKEIIGFSTRDQDSTGKPRKMKAADLNIQSRATPHSGILLSACQSNEYAIGDIDWERLENGAFFTNSLLSVIIETKGDVTYRRLVESIGAINYKKFRDISPIPGLYCNETQANLKFLGGPSNV